MRLLRKHDHPFLLLPQARKAAAASFGLYPAQTAKARAGRSLFRLLFGSGLSFKTEELTVELPLTSPFVQFLHQIVGTAPSSPPLFSVLAGNPATPGQRYLILLFNAEQKPVAVVKTGLTDDARKLVLKESNFLAHAPPKVPGLPHLLGKFEDDRLTALAMPFYQGDSPRATHERQVFNMLSSWVDSSKQVILKDLEPWRTLERKVPADQRSHSLDRLGGISVHPAIYHGDFAPWNIKISSNEQITVLDWERGDFQGVPGWDWFHYHLQNAILVEKLSGSALHQRAEELLQSRSFQDYARSAGIETIQRPLLVAYLLYIIYVINPSEGKAQAESLSKQLVV